MTGEEVAFWLMMGFSCLIGVFIGYLLFSPSRDRARLDDDLDLDDDRFDDEVVEPGVAPDTAPQREPWLADRETLREQARERAMARMAESEKRVRQEQAAAESAQDPQKSAPAPATAATATVGEAAVSESAVNEPGIRQSVASETAPDDGRDQPYFNPDTIKAWDQASVSGRRRKPGTWVKADGPQVRD